MSRIIAVVNPQDGVGKTTTTVTIAACAAEQGAKILVIDLDEQASATRWLRASTVGGTVLELLRSVGGRSPSELITSTCVNGVSIIPSGPDMYAADVVLHGTSRIEHVLATALHSQCDDYDLVLIDCPSDLSTVVVNALVAATEIVVPAMGVTMLTAVDQLLETVDLVRQRHGSAPAITRVLPIAVDGGELPGREVVAAPNVRVGSAVLPSIRRSVRVRHTQHAREPLTMFAPTAPVTDDFRVVTTALFPRAAL